MNEGTAAAREQLIDAPTVSSKRPRRSGALPTWWMAGPRGTTVALRCSPPPPWQALTLSDLSQEAKASSVLPIATTPLLGAGARRNATPTLTIPLFELSCHRRATAPPDATHVLRKTTSQGLQTADMFPEGPNV